MFTEKVPTCLTNATNINIIDTYRCGNETEVVNITCSVQCAGTTTPAVVWRHMRLNYTVVDTVFTTKTASTASVNISRLLQSSLMAKINTLRNGDTFACELIPTVNTSAITDEREALIKESNVETSCKTERITVNGKLILTVLHF